MQSPERDAGDLAQIDEWPLVSAGTRRTEGFDSFASHHPLDAIDVIAVAHGDARPHPIGPHDGGDALRGLAGVLTLGLSNDFIFRHASGDEIVAADSAF